MNCRNCLHSPVCGLYDALWDAIVIIDDYTQTTPNYGDELFEVLSRNCAAYNPMSEDIKFQAKTIGGTTNA